MAPSSSAPESPPPSMPDATEKDLQPFFVLHKALLRKSEKKPTGTGKTRRRIHLSQSSPNNGLNLDTEKAEACDDHRHARMRMELLGSFGQRSSQPSKMF